MRILHTADLHLRTNRDERWNALEAVIESAAREGAQVLAIAGDLFDRDVDAPALKADLRRRFEHFRGRVLIIPGNHDERGIRAGDFFGENVRVLSGHDTVCDVEGVRFVGVPFADVGMDETLRRLRAAAGQKVEGANILLYHGELLDLSPVRGAFGEEEGREYMPARLSDLAGLGFDCVLAGHFHRLHDVRACGEGYFVYSGSPVSITRRETGRRHATLVDVGSPPRALGLDTHHFIAVDVRLSPDEAEHPVARVERELAGLHPRASALLTVRGFVDLSRFGIREDEFHLALKEARARFDVTDFDAHACLDVGAILGADLFRRFSQKLEGSGLSDDDRARAREMTIRAMMEAPDAR
jgi:DNA repair exonuclease SbcCD nuclease subunit